MTERRPRRAPGSEPDRGVTCAGALEAWCRAACAGYPGVEIRDLSRSFRDGLAFCAIIHKHRPGLIDYASLSKDDVYQNNKLAFEVAQAKLGIPALLDPKDMASTKVPDCLSVITYLSHYHRLFTGAPLAGPAGSRPSRVPVPSCAAAKSQGSDSVRPLEGSADPASGGAAKLSSRRAPAACGLCFRPVHLIQRHLVDGQVYHRGCFRCRVCRSTLLAGSYRPGSEAGSLICSHHRARTTAAVEDPPGCDRAAATGGPRSDEEPEARSRPGHGTAAAEGGEMQGRSGEAAAEKPAPPRAPAPGGPGEGPGLGPGEPGEGRPEAMKTEGARDGTGRPVPAPRRTGVPVPAPRTKSIHAGIGAPAASASSGAGKASPDSPRISSPTSPTVKTNHPWLGIIHSGPWTQLPPAPAPLPSLQSRSVRPRPPPPPNPFGEDPDDDAQGAAAGPEPDLRGTLAGDAGHRGSRGTSDQVLPRSASVPAVASACSRMPLEAGTRVSASQSKLCKENPSDGTPAVPKSKTFQELPSRRAPAPGHGFPLIKRKVQADQQVSAEQLQVQMRQLDEQLAAVEQRGVELERKLRGCRSEEEETGLLAEWFALVHERHLLVCRDTELVYLSKQQKLEERQADVEFELRRLLNKPESEWSREDRGREQQLMEELVIVIEERNRIISCLDQDRQREREEDLLLAVLVKKRELQRKGMEELKKSKGRFRLSTVLKMLGRKAPGTKDPVDKKS